MKAKIKKLVSLAASAVMLASFSGVPASAEEYDVCDVNQDGKVSIQDVLYLNHYLIGKFTVDDPSIMDTNENYVISYADAQCIMASLTGVAYDCYFY